MYSYVYGLQIFFSTEIRMKYIYKIINCVSGNKNGRIGTKNMVLLILFTKNMVNSIHIKPKGERIVLCIL